MCSKTYNRAGQQGKSTDSCPEITELHKDYTTNKHHHTLYYRELTNRRHRYNKIMSKGNTPKIRVE